MKIVKILAKFGLLMAILSSFAIAENSIKMSDIPQDETLQRGKKVYDYWCLPCHGANMPGTNALVVLYKDSGIPTELTKRTDLVPELVEFFVREGKHSMPFFRKTEINDEDMKALSEYLSNPKN
ncbi:putative cytochrome c [Campylobacter blaseri]|uniref:Cytochrome c domain-containing protein n=1 Tax=Campylobacter blaseri TaxID=2042961 RepID=A0A2P8R3K1_9BACT|nr:cytochrome c [Campylobacter blaseri]PSM53077.1 hypothetical protein CQ405_00555 [Campylobacter blaseri]PSM54544.1 hypothetical protein CRN67_00555 [Campylobacter blaseri]QKF86986.1 putative cytochrome c [Campylobacter blaseri]